MQKTTKPTEVTRPDRGRRWFYSALITVSLILGTSGVNFNNGFMQNGENRREDTMETIDRLSILPGAEPIPGEVREKLLAALDERSRTYEPRTRHRRPDGTPLYTNRLVLEVSPYLLQHAHNPVNWHPWGDEAFSSARSLGKLVFLSIGYSTCHWCHVMEEESFDDLEVATIINRHFIPIKVDREERPDIDNLFMTVCQATTGSGGWPLTIIMTPEGKPIFAGTYFPKHARFGMPGLTELLPQIAAVWEKDPGGISKAGERIESALKRMEERPQGERLSLATIETAYSQLLESFDPLRGGFGSAPKFPTPHHLTFLLRYWKRTGEPTALEMVERTLMQMRLGGIYDQVGFGFHRYSTDPDWFLPHFEKMLYDQALLAVAYIEAYQATRNPAYAVTIREMLAYVLRDMTSPEGGFYSAEDADSEGEEGKFYLWTSDEIRKILGEEESSLFESCFNVEPDGNLLGEFGTLNLLHLKQPFDRLAVELKIDARDLEIRIDESRQRLFTARETRIHPLKDDKIITSWNGLMISALARAYQALGEPAYEAAARNAAGFILSTMTDDRGRLVRRYRNGVASLPAHLDDYAFVVQALLDLYEATFDVRYLNEGIRLNDLMMELFWDEAGGSFFFTADDGERLLVRQKEIYDGAIPSGNSIAALNLLRLWKVTSDREYGERAERTMNAFAGQVVSQPASYTQLLNALDFFLGPSYEVVIAGPEGNGDTAGMVRALREAFIPNKVVIFRPADGTEAEITRIAPYTRNQSNLDGRATAYVCRDFACQAPTADVGTMLATLGITSPPSQGSSPD